MKKVLFGQLFTFVLTFTGNAKENRANNFDFIGKIHNDIFSDFIKQTSGKRLSINEVLKLVKEIKLCNVFGGSVVAICGAAKGSSLVRSYNK